MTYVRQVLEVALVELAGDLLWGTHEKKGNHRGVGLQLWTGSGLSLSIDAVAVFVNRENLGKVKTLAEDSGFPQDVCQI